ncbi:MAG TPA: extracellular solute-binding protein, partial [Chloroflexota bacterium]|nr:extracellular solute-binding protein [Chloroflexota bacterium]
IDSMKFEDKLMGLAFHSHPGQCGFFYNQDLFAKAGVAAPNDSWKLDDLVNAAKKLTVQQGGKTVQYGWMSLYSWDPYVIWARVFGSDLISADGKKAQVDTPAVRSMLQWLYDNLYTWKVEPLSGQVEGSQQDMFVTQRAAMFQAGSSVVASMYKAVDNKFKWTVALLPIGPSGARGAEAIMHLEGISSKTKYRSQSWEFVKSLCGHEAGVEKVLDGAGAPGGRPDCWTDPRIIKTTPEYAIVAKAFVFAQPDHPPANFRGLEVSSVGEQNLAAIWTCKATVAQGAKTTNNAMQQVLDKPPE